MSRSVDYCAVFMLVTLKAHLLYVIEEPVSKISFGLNDEATFYRLGIIWKLCNPVDTGRHPVTITIKINESN
uniref:AlNc14C36G3200 protein n=2 Tax=Albugo laibachii Nc14 TaxID=890382 RepID=F0W8S5_9STRA|nr:AlNc14C36G3200 [Albugo laibachii Nc14]|eukprot:CCA17533.1 AlNc14C36G3200 [Albugo laibachii Nc14]